MCRSRDSPVTRYPIQSRREQNRTIKTAGEEATCPGILTSFNTVVKLVRDQNKDQDRHLLARACYVLGHPPNVSKKSKVPYVEPVSIGVLWVHDLACPWVVFHWSVIHKQVFY
jgi:hypothetical protein